MSEPDTEYDGQAAITDIRTPDGPADLKLPTVKFVHYPGSQQLIVWLPKPAYQGYAELSVTREGQDIERAPVTSRVNGSVQILFATLGWPPGDYVITLTHEEGWRHIVELKKYAAGEKLPPPPPPPPELYSGPPPPTGPIVYRDGFGNVIPDLDLEMRARAQEDIARIFLRHLEYEGSFRGGTIIYVDGARRISFWHEMAGGEAKFYIDIPPPEQWEGRTGTPLSERDDIVGFIAMRVKQEKCSAWRYEITPTAITFY